MKEKVVDVKNRIDKIETTDDCLSSRADLALVTRYIKNIRICHFLSNLFSFVKKSSKGIAVRFLFHQLICFFFDGSNFHLSHFDDLVKDEGYAASIETAGKHMASSHSIKRFFRAVSNVRVWLFRKVLQQMFIWRLLIEQPKLIKLGLDTMVMDNDDALKREGVDPTYKKVKGFQPLQMYWGRYIVDTIFRNGKAHSNHGNHVSHMIKGIVRLIRKHYSKEVPIIFLADTGWRTIYTKPIADEEGQILIELARPETIIYTNIGMDNAITRSILHVKETKDTTINPQAIITQYHQRGRDELVNRGLKDFCVEQITFKRFTANAAFYYMMVISFFLFESFKYDINIETIPVEWYATTFRRRCLDVAGKIIRTGRQLIMKIARPVFELLQFEFLWEKSICPSPLH